MGLCLLELVNGALDARDVLMGLCVWLELFNGPLSTYMGGALSDNQAVGSSNGALSARAVLMGLCLLTKL